MRWLAVLGHSIERNNHVSPPKCLGDLPCSSRCLPDCLCATLLGRAVAGNEPLQPAAGAVRRAAP